ncbi:stage II sporulation protein M [Candidatus Bathyarchaeota archaeon]|nr:stage II sporulation protein M [Candidatus Bathyarchaeota archaeon]
MSRLRLKTLFKKAEETFKSCIQRNKVIIKATALAFFTIISLSMILTVFVFSMVPWLSDWFRSVAQSEKRYIAIPPPFTENLYSYIFLNNVGHFWNPLKMLVWVPLLGTFILGSELLLNGGTIGIVAVIAGITQGIFYPIVGLAPHGILEIPAFILQFASIIRWHVATIDAIMAKITGEKVESARFKQGVKDTIILAIASVILFMIAAYIETYITPYLLGI